MKNLFTKLRIELLILFIISLIFVLIMDFWLINIPEIFKWGAEFGKIIYNLSLSYVSAFIFYFVVVYLKEQNDRNNLYGYIAQKTLMVIGSAKNLINSMASVTDTKLNGEFSDIQELTALCTSINPNSNAPLILGRSGNYANWIQYLLYFKQRSETATGRIFSKIQYLDSELLTILSKIEDCGHFDTITFIAKMPIRNTDMTAFQRELSEYFDLIEELQRYYSIKLKKFT